MKLGMFLPLLGFHSNEGVMFTQLQRRLWTHEVSLGSGAASTCSGDVPRTAHYWQRWPRGLSRFQFSWSIPSCAFGWYVPQQLLEPSQSLAVIPFIGACLWLPIAFLQVYCACSICACSLSDELLWNSSFDVSVGEVGGMIMWLWLQLVLCAFLTLSSQCLKCKQSLTFQEYCYFNSLFMTVPEWVNLHKRDSGTICTASYIFFNSKVQMTATWEFL